jgi:D-alanyl-D-alanine carboxypeptidase (penicillin-binding protein 5/6)
VRAYAKEGGKEGIPVIESKSAILMDCKTGKILWEKDAFEPMAMASTTKIMTAIITLENANLEDMVTVSQKATLAPKVKMFLQKGEEVKLEYLLYALMLESSNDAAVAIAEHVGGTVEGFCKMMTDKAKEIGTKDTIFETPNGLDAGNHHSTSYDLALISSYALQNDKFMKLINTPSISFSSSKRPYTFNNKNRLLRELDGANGIKTGFTNKAGHCFVGSAKRGGMQLVSVVLQSGWGERGKNQKFIDSKELLNYGFKNYKYYDVIDNTYAAANVAIERSKTPELGLYYKDCLELPLTEQEFQSISIKFDMPQAIKAPVLRNQKLGVAKVFINGKLYTEIDLVTVAEAARHDLKTCMERVLNEFISIGTRNEVNIILPEF